MTRGAVAGSGAFRGLGRSIAFASAGFLGGFGLAAAVRGAVSELSDSIKVSAQTEAALKSTGGVANVTARDIDKLSQSLLRKSGVDDEVIKSGANMLLTFTQVRNEAGKGNDIFNQATKAALDMSVALGTDMKSSALQLGKALNDPVAGLLALRRVGVAFTADQRAQIKVLVETGHTLEAQKIILRELNTEFGGSAAKLGGELPGKIAILRESVKNLSADLLRGLTPSITSGTKAAQAWIDKLQESGEAQETAKRVGKDLAEIVRDAAAAARVAAKGFGLLSKAVDGDANALKVLGGAALAWKVTGAVNAVQGMMAVKRAAEAAAGAEVAAGAAGAGAAGGRTGAALLLSRLRMLKAIGTITIGVELVINRQRVQDYLKEHLGWVGGTLGASLFMYDTLWKTVSGGGGGKETTLMGGSGAALGGLLSGAGSTTMKPSAGAPPTSFGRRVSGPTAGLTTLQGALPGAKGGTAIDYAGHAKKSYHYSGEALDIGDGGNPAGLISDWNFLYPHRHQLAELIWNPPAAVQALAPGSGAGYFWGTPGKFSGHTDHIHVAFTGTADEAAKIFQGKVLAKINDRGGVDSTSAFSKGAIKATMTRLDTAVSRAKALTPKSVADDLSALNAERDFVKQVIAHTGGTKELYDQLAQLNDEIDSLATGKKSKSKTGLNLLSAGVRGMLADARGTKGLDDDLRALKAARAELEKKPKTVPVREELARLNKEINAIDDAKAKARLDAIAKTYAATAKKVKASIDAQSAAWDKHLAHLKDVADQARTEFEDKWSTAANAVLRAFDKATAAGLAALGAPKQTAAEKELADFLAGRSTAALARNRASEDAQFQTDLAAAATPEEVAKVQADRAQQIRERELDDQQVALEQAATQSRTAAEDAATAAQAAYQEQRDLQRDELQKWLNEQEQKLEDGKTLWDDFYGELKRKAAEGGWDVGSQFWAAWDAANTAHADDASAAGHAAAVEAAGPGASGVDTIQSLHEAAVAGTIDAATYQYLLRGRKLDLPGFSGGGWASSRPRSMDPRDTILARLRDGEYVMNTDEVAAGRPRWSRGGGDVYLSGDIILNGEKVGKAVAVHVTNAQERQIGYPSPRG